MVGVVARGKGDGCLAPGQSTAFWFCLGPGKVYGWPCVARAVQRSHDCSLLSPQEWGALLGPFASPQGDSLAWKPHGSFHRALGLHLEPPPTDLHAQKDISPEDLTNELSLPGGAELGQAGKGTLSWGNNIC